MKIFSREIAQFLWRYRNFLESERYRRLAVDEDDADTARLEDECIHVGKVADQMWEMKEAWGKDDV